MSWIVEVCHASDHDLDGQWYELELCATEDAANRSKRWYGRARGYRGRPLRVRQVDTPVKVMPAPNSPPPAWRRAVQRARRMMRTTR